MFRLLIDFAEGIVKVVPIEFPPIDNLKKFDVILHSNSILKDLRLSKLKRTLTWNRKLDNILKSQSLQANYS